jgi:hypothetical protein
MIRASAAVFMKAWCSRSNRFFRWARNGPIEGGDDWTLRADTGRPTVQYEHTLVATKRGAIVLTAVAA